MGEFHHGQKPSDTAPTQAVDDQHVEADHDPDAARKASNVALRKYTSKGAKPAPTSTFGTPAPSASDRGYGSPGHDGQAVGPGGQDAVMDDAMQGVKTPLPKPKEGTGSPVATDKAPTVEDVFDPTRPALDGASQDTLLTIIQQNVNDLYQEVFLGQLATLKADLSKTAPVPETPFAMKLLAWLVETIASGAISYVGGFLGKELFGHEAPHEEATVAIGGTESKPGAAPAHDWKEKATEKVGEAAGESGGGALKEKMLERPTTAPNAEEASPALTTGGLLDEFVIRERHVLLAKKSDILARLMLMHEHASGRAKMDTVELGNKLRDLIGAPELTAWFRNKVAMEWLNFSARVALGPRAEGQSTDMIGANAIGGIADGGGEARQQWAGSAGMIEIVLNVPDTVNGTKGIWLGRASIPTSYGAAQILQRLQGYNLGTMPVYRRVWLQTGGSQLDESPAFVITPDGNIETDAGNPVLAAIGNGKPTPVGEITYMVGTDQFTDDERKDPQAWARRAIGSAHGAEGAHLVRDFLNGISPQVLK